MHPHFTFKYKRQHSPSACILFITPQSSHPNSHSFTFLEMASVSTSQSCSRGTFANMTLFGAEILSTSADLVAGYSYPILDGWRYSQPSVTVDNATFCNVTVTYTHPNQNDTINAEVWLPLEDTWNGRLQAIGGGGWVAGRFVLSYAGMAGAIVDGYATASTDASLPGDPSSPADWGLVSPGDLNLVDLDNFGQRSLGDLVSHHGPLRANMPVSH
jgi:hypothetical protein